MALQAVFIVFPLTVVIKWLGLMTLFAGIWIEIFRILADRLMLGPSDTEFRLGLASQLAADNDVATDEFQSQEGRLRMFITLFCGLAGIVAMSYAAIYSAIDTLAGDDFAFTNIPHNWTRVFHLLYFSVVTLATVGYGDITPRYDSLLARLFVASEIAAGFFVLVVILSSVSLTFEKKRDTNT